MVRPKYITKLNGEQLDVPVRVPSSSTLKRYGLSYREWRAILIRQRGVCPICGTFPRTGRTNLDHEHVPNWKTLPDRERKRYVRGILCGMCNYRMLPRTSTPFKLRNAAQYLEDYENRAKI